MKSPAHKKAVQFRIKQHDELSNVLLAIYFLRRITPALGTVYGNLETYFDNLNS